MPPVRSDAFDRPRPRRAVRYAKRTAIAGAGGTLVAGGAAMLVLPGPGLLVIAAGLAVLATEFAWAERRLEQVREQARNAANKVPRRRRAHAAPAPDPTTPTTNALASEPPPRTRRSLP